MYPRYYALRRLNPCRGVVQVVAVGCTSAHSFDGVTWHLRDDDGHGWVRPTGIWVAGEGLKAGHAANLADLLPALETPPALPFPLIDTQELWLLDREDGLPLALLASAPAAINVQEPADTAWLPFAPKHTGFHSPALAAQGVNDAALQREMLARQVNDAAGPSPRAVWYQRGDEGDGVGRDGSHLPPDAFPELLVREIWNSRLESSAIADYHATLAPVLLCWPRLSTPTRARLERHACDNPCWLARLHRLLPARVDAPRIQAALVAARLEQAAGSPEPDLN